MTEQTMRLSVPPDGIRAGDLILRFPALDDVDAFLRRIDKTLYSLLPGE